MSLDNFSIPELVWTVLNIGTFITVGHLAREAQLDLDAVRRSGRNGLLLGAARASRRMFILLLLAAGAFVMAGLVSGFLVPINRAAQSVAADTANIPSTVIVVAFFMVADVALLLLSLDAARARAHTFDRLASAEEASRNGETALQAQDREVGDERRVRQAADEDAAEAGHGAVR